MDNLFPQYQLDFNRTGKGFETWCYDPDLDVMRLRFAEAKKRLMVGQSVRLLGLKGECLDSYTEPCQIKT